MVACSSRLPQDENVSCAGAVEAALAGSGPSISSNSPAIAAPERPRVMARRIKDRRLTGRSRVSAIKASRADCSDCMIPSFPLPEDAARLLEDAARLLEDAARSHLRVNSIPL